MSQAHYEVFREQLAIKYPAFGHALWEPNPRNPDRPVQVGDVGFIRRGKFHRLFNALLSADDSAQELGVPEYHEPLVPSLLDHIDRGSLDSNNYCSAGVRVEADQGYHSSGPDDFRQVSFQYERTRGAAVLSLPVAARSENTLAQGDFGRWIVKHISTWFAFARKLGLGIEQMEEIILVTGCDRARSWTNVAFLGGQADAQVTFGVNVEGSDTTINFQFSPENARGGILRHGPEGANLPENQCVFIRGFRVARSFWILPKHLKAAAGPSQDPGYDCDPGTELVSIPAVTQYHDPLRLLLDYIAEQVSDCDMVIAHDDDLVAINGLGHDTSLETLEPDVMMDLLRRSNIEIHKVWCDSSPTSSPSNPGTDMAIVKVAMLSTTFQNWNTASLFQQPPPAARNIDDGHTRECRGMPQPTVPGGLPIPNIRGDANNDNVSLLADHGDSVSTTLQDLGDSAPLDGGHDAEDTLPEKTRNPLSSVWSSLRKFSYVERHRLVPAIVVTCGIVILLGWIFSFALDAIFKLIFTLLLASVPLSVLFERKNTHRRLDDIYERIDALQYHVMSLQTNLAVPSVVEGVRYSAPIMTRAAPAIPGMIEPSSMPSVVHPVMHPFPAFYAPTMSPVIPSPVSPVSPPLPWGEPIPRFSPPATNARRKPLSSKFFGRIKFSLPARPARPVPPSPATAGLGDSDPYLHYPPTNVQRKPRSSKFFNRIRYAFTTRPPSPIPLSHGTATERYSPSPAASRTHPPWDDIGPTIINVPSQRGRRGVVIVQERSPSRSPRSRSPASFVHRHYMPPQRGAVIVRDRSPSPRSHSPTSFVHRRYRTRAPSRSRTPSPPYAIPHPTIVNIPPQPGLVIQKVPLHSPSPRYPPAPSPHSLSHPVQSSDDRTTSIPSLRTHQRPEEATLLESL